MTEILLSRTLNLNLSTKECECEPGKDGWGQRRILDRLSVKTERRRCPQMEIHRK